MTLKTLFNRRWWWTTLLVMAAMGVLIRLGFWQLDRLEQRRARNAAITSQLTLAPLNLNDNSPLANDLTILKNRKVTAQGSYDFSQQVALKSQIWQGSPGVHLLTPLLIEDENELKAVLVDRGWIPQDQAPAEQWSQFDETGVTTATGFVRLTQPPATNNTATTDTGQTNLTLRSEWYRVDIEAIQTQIPYPLLPIFIQQSPPSAANDTLPYRMEPNVDLSEGSHFGYALQWYTFALVLGVGYLYYVSRDKPPHNS